MNLKTGQIKLYGKQTEQRNEKYIRVVKKHWTQNAIEYYVSNWSSRSRRNNEPETIFENIMAETFPELMIGTMPYIQDALQMTSRIKLKEYHT